MEPVNGTKGRSGQQLDIWSAVFGPLGDDGYVKPLFDKATGEVDPAVAEYWRDNYDLRHVLETNNAASFSQVGSRHLGWQYPRSLRDPLKGFAEPTRSHVAAIYDHFDEFAQVHPSLESMSLDRAVSLDSINPYHAGAIRFFEDRGIWTAAASRMQQRLLQELGVTR